MNPNKVNNNVDFNPDDEQNWDDLMGTNRTDEIDRVTAEEEQEIKDLYPGEYDDQPEDIEPEIPESSAGETSEDIEKAA